MGLQFIQMRPEDRARLHRFLIAEQEAPTAAVPDKKSARPAVQPPVPTPGSAPASAADAAPSTPASASAETAPPPDEPAFEQELKRLLELAEDGTYYRLLGVTTDSTAGQVKKSFYSLARKFHPDHHMAKTELVGSLQKLMEAVTEAYKTLTDENKRAVYDKALAASSAFRLRRDKTESQQIIEESLARANECIRARNFMGSIVWLRKCVAVAPEDAKYHAMLARSLRHAGQYPEEAAEHFEKAVELDPLNSAVYFQFAEFCEEMEIPERARELYSKVLEIDPTHAKSRERLAQLDAAEKAGKSGSVFSRVFSRKS
jgi:tetratricopeptide (TPR) repeat protein